MVGSCGHPRPENTQINESLPAENGRGNDLDHNWTRHRFIRAHGSMFHRLESPQTLFWMLRGHIIASQMTEQTFSRVRKRVHKPRNICVLAKVILTAFIRTQTKVANLKNVSEPNSRLLPIQWFKNRYTLNKACIISTGRLSASNCALPRPSTDWLV